MKFSKQNSFLIKKQNRFINCFKFQERTRNFSNVPRNFFSSLKFATKASNLKLEFQAPQKTKTKPLFFCTPKSNSFFLSSIYNLNKPFFYRNQHTTPNENEKENETINQVISEEMKTKEGDSLPPPEESTLSQEEEIREKILAYSLEEVKRFGWTMEAITVGAQKAGLLSVSHGILENGVLDLIHYFLFQADQEFVFQLEKMDLTQ